MKKVRNTLIFYGIALEIIFALNAWSSPQPGSSSLAQWAFFLFIPICLTFFGISIYRMVKGRKELLPAIVTHSICIAGMLLLIVLN